MTSPTESEDEDASVLLKTEGNVSVITLNRPEKLNSVTRAMQGAISDALMAADYDESSNVIVVTGSGRAFCAGGDIGAMSGSEFGGMDRVLSGGRHLVDTFLRLEKPVIAMVNGDAVGLGATIALLADVVYMSETARIGDRHVKVGLVAGDGGSILWPLLVGPSRAKELLFTGRLLSGLEAEQLGLVSKAVPLEELQRETFALARELAALPPYAIRATKLSINKAIQLAAATTLDLSLAYEHLSMKTPEHTAAIQHFLTAKRTGG